MSRSRVSIGPQRHPDTYQAVLAAAETLLAEQGYGGFTLDEVARRAQSSKPTLYKWWHSKAGLIAELYTRQQTLLPPVPDLGNLSAELRWLSQALWHHWHQSPHGETLCGLIAEAQRSEPLRVQLREVVMGERLLPVRQVFERAQLRGDMAEGAQIEVAVRLFAGFHWYHLLLGMPPSDAELDVTADLIAAALVGQRGGLTLRDQSKANR